MFDRDRWEEIWATLSRNKLRTILTAFGVSWGILMLLIMLGAGNGLQSGVQREFSGMVSNSIFMWSQGTSMPYKGYRKGRWYSFNNGDTKALKSQIEEIDLISPGLQLGGWRGANNVSRNNKIGAFEINGYYPVAQEVKIMRVPQGRFINDKDIEEKRKICIIGDIVKDVLFEKGEDVLGKYIKIQGIYFKVVGQFKSARSGDDAENEDRSIYIPFTTFQHVFNKGDKVGWYVMTSKKGIPAAVLDQKARTLLKARHSIHPKDERAIGGWNLEEEMQKFNNIFKGINILSWTVGVLTLLAGIIGVSNIMLVIIKERTQEIGIRRALGATPLNIITQIILESILLTTLAGVSGFMVGIGLLENLGVLIQHQYFTNPEVDFNVAVTALTILVCSGAFAGIIPATRAVSIKPIDALRTE